MSSFTGHWSHPRSRFHNSSQIWDNRARLLSCSLCIVFTAARDNRGLLKGEWVRAHKRWDQTSPGVWHWEWSPSLGSCLKPLMQLWRALCKTTNAASRGAQSHFCRYQSKIQALLYVWLKCSWQNIHRPPNTAVFIVISIVSVSHPFSYH